MPDLYELTVSTDEPFFGGGTTGTADEVGYPISIDGRGFIPVLDSTLSFYHRYQRTLINLLNTQQSTSGNDSAQTAPEVWRRVSETWEQGAGQSHADRATALPGRYATSQGINPFTSWQFSLLNDTANQQVLAAGQSLMVRVNAGLLFVGIVGSTTGYWFTTPTAKTSVALSGTLVDACSDGQNLYVLYTNGGIEKYTASGAHSAYYAAATVTIVAGRMLLRYLKGFLVLASGPSLYDVSTAAPILIYTHPLAGFTWVDGCSGLSAAYLLGGIGDRWHVAAMSILANATHLDVPLLDAGPLPSGEIAYSIGSYLGYVTVGSQNGWRFGVPASDGTVTFGRLIDSAGPVYCFDGQDRFVWYGQNDTTNTGLGRADLATFTSAITPAYANDLRAGVAGTVRCVTTFAGKRMFTIDGVGVFAEASTLVPSGVLEQGTVTFNTPDQKVGLYTMLSAKVGQGTVLVEASYDGGAYTSLGLLVDGQTDLGHAKMQQNYQTVQLRYTLTRSASDTTQGPTVTRTEVRAMPITGQATEWRVPLRLMQDETWANRSTTRDVLDDHNFLMGLVNTKREFVFREGTQMYPVHVTDFIEWPEKQDDTGNFYQGLFILIIRSVV